jgi:predicted acetyltransferase
MVPDQIELRALRVEDEVPFLDAVREFETEEMLFAFHYDPGINFQEYVDNVNSWPYGKFLPSDFVPNSYYVAVKADIIIGRVSFRHELNEFLERIGGHIGYAVIPSQRGRGYAKNMLKQSLRFARAKGLNRVLITCDVNNIASIRVVEANGGIFENTTNEPELKTQKHRYWINL